MKTSEDRIEALEELAAHQAIEVETLSDVVRKQGEALEALRIAMLRLRDRVTEVEESGDESHHSAPPPHY